MRHYDDKNRGWTLLQLYFPWSAEEHPSFTFCSILFLNLAYFGLGIKWPLGPANLHDCPASSISGTSASCSSWPASCKWWLLTSSLDSSISFPRVKVWHLAFYVVATTSSEEVTWFYLLKYPFLLCVWSKANWPQASDLSLWVQLKVSSLWGKGQYSVCTCHDFASWCSFSWISALLSRRQTVGILCGMISENCRKFSIPGPQTPNASRVSASSQWQF